MDPNHAINLTLQDERQVNFTQALIQGDRPKAREIFQEWLDATDDLEDLYENLVQPSLYEVGTLWERGRISVATEHLATAMTESLLNLVYPRLFQHPRNGQTAVVSCAANEHHQIGGKMVADLFELKGWRSYFLGANTPLRDLMDLVQEKSPQALALSLTVYHHFGSLERMVKELRARFPELPILVGGQAFRWGGKERIESIPGTRVLNSLSSLKIWMTDRNGHV